MQAVFLKSILKMIALFFSLTGQQCKEKRCFVSASLFNAPFAVPKSPG